MKIICYIFYDDVFTKTKCTMASVVPSFISSKNGALANEFMRLKTYNFQPHLAFFICDFMTHDLKTRY